MSYKENIGFFLHEELKNCILETKKLPLQITCLDLSVPCVHS